MSRITFKTFGLLGVLATVLGGCSHHTLMGAHYWQRINMSDAAYIQGPQAQVMLNRDIAHCVSELRETEHSDVLRRTIPADADSRVLDPDEQKMADWDAPSHEGALLTEHSDVHDFEGCMLAAGWERTSNVPYDVAAQSRANYFKASAKYDHKDPDIKKPDYGVNDKGPDSKLND